MRQINFIEALTPLLLLIGSLYITVAFYHVNVSYALIAPLLAAVLIAKHAGASLKTILSFIWQGIKPTIYIIIFFLLVGILIGIWHLSGTIPAMIFYGLHLVRPHTFYLSVFVISSMVSLLLGTSMGTVSTVGVALIGIAHGLNLSLPVTAGAIISGAFLGDRSSPVSSSANLTAIITGTELYSNLRHMLNTISIPLIISCISYLALGQSISTNVATGQLPILKLLAKSFTIHWIVLIPPLSILILSMFRVNTIRLLSTGILLGAGIAYYVQGVNLGEILKTAVMGYQGDPSLGELSKVIKGGGMVSFLSMEMVIILSASLNGILEGIGALKVLLNRILSAINSSESLNIFSMLTSMFVCLITANQTIALIIPARIMLPLYKQLNVSTKNLARALSDSGVLVVPLIPWSVVGLLCTGILGVDTLHYIPFTFLCWLTPMLSIVISLLRLSPKLIHHSENV